MTGYMQFRRLAGGKKRKNWQESLNDIIDIKEDDVKEEIKVYQKYHSEETVNKLYKQDPVSNSYHDTVTVDNLKYLLGVLLN